jgi:hypothetical protein
LGAEKMGGKDIIVLLEMTFRLVVDEWLQKILELQALERSL